MTICIFACFITEMLGAFSGEVLKVASTWVCQKAKGNNVCRHVLYCLLQVSEKFLSLLQKSTVFLYRDPIPHFISKCFLSKNNRWPSVFDREIQSGRVYLSLSSFSCYHILLLDNRKVFVQDTSVCHRYKIDTFHG